MTPEILTTPEDRKAMTRLFIVLAVIVGIFLIPALARAETRIVGSRPAGCPKQFCGCALSLKLFGAIKPTLNLAANWPRKFPRTNPAPQMVAARPGHVMQLIEHRGGNKWLVWTANSCKRRTCVRERSIAGFVVVNPFSRMASLK